MPPDRLTALRRQRALVAEHLAWLDAEGPTSPALVRYVADHQAEFDFVLFFSFRYYHAYHGARAVPAGRRSWVIQPR